MPESLLASSLGNVLTPLFGGQPLMILVASKSTIVFDEILHNFSVSNSIPFLAFRFWVGFWTILMLLLLVATNASGVLLILTRFTLELFSVLLSIVFTVLTIFKFWDIHRNHANSNVFFSTDRDCYCYGRVFNTTSQWELTNCTKNDEYDEIRWEGDDCDKYNLEVFFFSIILMLGTFLVAFYLKKFYYTPFLTSLVSFKSIILIISCTFEIHR